MRKACWIVLAVAVAWAPCALGAPTIRSVEIDGTITPVTVMKVRLALDDAEEAGDDFLLIEMDTPGGLADSMEKVVKLLLNSPVPVVTWVGPSGARAASAGFFILMASDVAVMAPGTRTGAASVVYGPGQKSEEGDILLRKANKDAAALIRSIAEKRGRNVDAAEQAVLSAEAYTETVALERGLIEFLAADRAALLEALQGYEVRRFDGTVVTLETEGAEIVSSKFDLKQRVMEFLATPLVSYLLFLGGLLGLYVEITHPGLVFPGVFGALCLVLFFLSGQILPIDTIAVLLILLAIVMFILEIKVVSYGMLTVGGIACLLVGSIMLVDGPIPELRVPLGAVIPATVLFAAIIVFVLYKVTRAQASRVGTGVEGLVGETGQVTVSLEPEGKVFVHGEIWEAISRSGPIPRGGGVRVVGVRNMTLLVDALEPDRPAERSGS